EVPSGVEGIVIDTQKFSRRMSLSEEERKEFEQNLKDVETESNKRIAQLFASMIREIEEVLDRPLKDEDGKSLSDEKDADYLASQAGRFSLRRLDLGTGKKATEVEKVYR